MLTGDKLVGEEAVNTTNHKKGRISNRGTKEEKKNTNGVVLAHAGLKKLIDVHRSLYLASRVLPSYG